MKPKNGKTITEQDFYNFIQSLSDDIIVDRIKEIEIAAHNHRIEKTMLRNILINRGKEVSEHYIRDFEYAKFYEKGDELR